MSVTYERLPCGRELEPLVEQVYDGVSAADPEHQQTCAYCQEALGRLRLAVDDLRLLAGERIRPPRGISGRVLAQLRRERGVVLIGAGPLGSDTVSDTIVAQVARRAAESIPGVRHASAVADLCVSGEVDVHVRVSADLGPSLPDLGDAIRRTVIGHVVAYVGARLGHVDVAVDDVV